MLPLWGSETQEQRVPPAVSTGDCLAACLLWRPLPQPCQFPSDCDQAKKGNNTPKRLVATRAETYQTSRTGSQRVTWEDMTATKAQHKCPETKTRAILTKKWHRWFKGKDRDETQISLLEDKVWEMPQTTEKNTKKLKSRKTIWDFEGRSGRPNMGLIEFQRPKRPKKDSGIISTDSWDQELQPSCPIL